MPFEVRDISVVGMGLVRELPVGLTVGEQVYLMLSFDGYRDLGPVHGAMLRAHIRRRRPDRCGFFVGVEISDLRQTRCAPVVAYIERMHQRALHGARADRSGPAHAPGVRGNGGAVVGRDEAPLGWSTPALSI